MYLLNQTSSAINLTWDYSINDNETLLNISSNGTKQNSDSNNLTISIFLSCFCIITIFGNGLVIFAVIKERYLKTGMSNIEVLFSLVKFYSIICKELFKN